ncbi:MAG: DivIVA domain-containing protein, partial [Cyclobacteriaceae bacterium]|nr:DivIVA domain-containing protein [Cyclobacteriaceae bacterium]
MKITPLEIRQKSFEKGFRGYEKEEVNAYLHSLSMEWERLLKENKEAQAKAVELEKEVSKLRAVESSLFKTLKTAEDTGANMIDQATKMAEIHMKETEMRTEGILNEAKTKARDTIEEAELMAKKTIEDMEDQLKSLIQDYKTLENFRD